MTALATLGVACAALAARRSDAFLNAEPIASDATPWVIEGELTLHDPDVLDATLRTKHDVLEVRLDPGVVTIFYVPLQGVSGDAIDPYLRIDQVHHDGREEHLLSIDDGPAPIAPGAFLEARVTEPVVLRLSLGVLRPAYGAYRLVIMSDADDPRPVAPLRDLARVLPREQELDDARGARFDRGGDADREAFIADADRLIAERERIHGASWWEVVARREREQESRSRASLEPAQRIALEAAERAADTAQADGDDARALTSFRRAGEHAFNFLGPEHPVTVRARIGIAGASLRLGKLQEAHAELEKVVSILRTRAEHPGPALAGALADLARVKTLLGRLSEAEVLQSEALRVRQSVHPRVHPEVALCTAQLAHVLLAMGRVEEATSLFETALGIRRLYSAPGDPALIAGLSDLAAARLAGASEAAADSRFLCEAAISARLPLLARTARALDTQRDAIATRDQQAVADAVASAAPQLRPLPRASAGTSAAETGASHRLRDLLSQHASALRGLGAAQLAEGAHADAVRMLRQAALVARASSPGYEPALADTLSLLSRALRAAGEAAEAREIAQDALAMRECLYQGAHADIASSLADLAQLHMDAQQWDDASRLLERARLMHDQVRLSTRGDTESRVLMDQRLSVTQVARALARVRLEQNRPEEALAALDAGRARAFMDIFVAPRDHKLSAPDDVLSQVAAAQSIETGLQNRVRVSERELVEIARDPAPDASRVARVRQRLAIERADLRDAVARTNALRGRWVPAMRTRSAADFADWITAGTVVLAYAWDPHEPFVILYDGASGSAHHAMLVHPRGIRAIHEHTARLALQLRTCEPIDNQDVADLARTLIPEPLQESIASAGRLLVIADGPVAAIPMSLLLDALWPDRAAAQRRPFVNAPSVSFYINRADADRDRMSAGLDTPEDDSMQFLLVARPDFATGAPPPGRAESAPRAAALHSSAERGAHRGEAFADLPGTEVEATLILGAIASASGSQAEVLTGTRATVPALVEAVQRTSPRVLHIATHGVIGSAQQPLNAALVLARADDHSPYLTLEDLLRDWAGRLPRTDLVVLSACETGRGADAGDVEYSLPWGFFAAGATAVVASLWQVDDISTALLMARFHENRLGAYTDQRRIGSGPDRHMLVAGRRMRTVNALSEAKEWVRSLTVAQRDRLLAAHPQFAHIARSRGTAPIQPDDLEPHADARPYEHPHYWAGFILLGSPD